jgi:hypothetical protein
VPAGAAGPHVWLEGEQPARATVPWKATSAAHKDYLSGEKWLQVAVSAKDTEKLPPPAVFRYVVPYADGKTVDVPVRLGEGVDHWLSKTPAGLKNAAVARAAPFPNDRSGEQVVVYQMQWQNVRPEAEIASVELTYDAKVCDPYGTPILLGLTAAGQRSKE